MRLGADNGDFYHVSGTKIVRHRAETHGLHLQCDGSFMGEAQTSPGPIVTERRVSQRLRGHFPEFSQVSSLLSRVSDREIRNRAGRSPRRGRMATAPEKRPTRARGGSMTPRGLLTTIGATALGFGLVIGAAPVIPDV